MDHASRFPQLRVVDAAGGDWPHTTRVTPWLVAGFLALVWLVPVDSIQLPFSGPIDAKLDRVVLAVVFAIWVVGIAGGVRFNRLPTGRPLLVAVGLFFVFAFASVAVNVSVLANLDELALAIKKLALLLAYLAFFMLVVQTVRPSELRAFSTFFIILAVLTALGTIYEYRTGTNVFFDWSAKLLPGSVEVMPPPADPRFERPAITGPTTVGLAVATMLAMAMPFVLIRLLDRRTWREKAWETLALAIILAGSFATIRKTAAILPVTVAATLLFYRPRATLRLLPLAIVLVLMIQVMAPGALASVRGQLFGTGFSAVSTQDRASDYAAVTPDVKKYAVLGRGYGTYDNEKYRTLDNQYLLSLIETGALGLMAYLGVIGAAVASAHHAVGRNVRVRSPTALAAAAGVVAFGVANALFDALAFPQVPYTFFFVAGMIVVAGLPDSEYTAAPDGSSARRARLRVVEGAVEQHAVR